MTTEMKRKTFKMAKAFIVVAVGGMCSVASAVTYYVSTTGDDDNPGTQAEPFRTIQAALSAPNSWDGIVYIEAGTYQISSELTIRDNVNGITIRSVSGNPADVTIDAHGNCRCFNCTGTEHYTYTFRGITFANGAVDGDGGGVLAVEKSKFDDCVFTNCTATGKGGAIYSASSIRSINNVRIEGCSSTSSSGGGIFLAEAPYGGVFNSSIENCTAATIGGGMYLNSSSSAVSTITNCNVSLNTCELTGGAGIFANQKATILNCTITNNVCNHSTGSDSVGGSGIRFNRSGTIDGCLIQGNSFANIFDSGDGGGSAVWMGANGSLLLNSAIISNSGPRSVAFQIRYGGGVVSNCLIKANVARQTGGNGRGGMCYFKTWGTDTVYDLLITDCRFIDNTANFAGGLVNADLAGSTEVTVRIRNCLMTGNVQTGSIGLIYATGGTVRRLALENCTVVSNSVANGPVVDADESAINRVSCSGCAILFNNGKDAFSSTYKTSANVTYCCTELTGMGESNRTYDSSKPLFEDLLGGDFRPAAGSQLLNAVPAAAWMGNGGKRSPSRDLGTGYELRAAGTYGVDVVWTDTVPRLHGAAADIGCFERWMPPGFQLIVR